MVERQLPKLHTRVRFPSPAPIFRLTIPKKDCKSRETFIFKRLLIASDPCVSRQSPKMGVQILPRHKTLDQSSVDLRDVPASVETFQAAVAEAWQEVGASFERFCLTAGVRV